MPDSFHINIYQSAQATFEVLGAIFPMASLKARQGFLRKREREAKRAAAASNRVPPLAVGIQQARDLARDSNSTDGRES